MEKVVAYPYKRPYALWRLICFPWAGDGASHLAQWGRLFSSSTAVSSIRFPGRESRRRETFAKGMTDIVNEIANVLLKELQEKTLAFFGHSFGSYVSFAVPLHLKEKYGLELIHLFVSGAHAPNSEAFISIKSIPTHYAKDKDVLTYLEILGGTPSELLQNEDIKNHLISTVREDIRVLQTWFFEMAEGNIPFSCGITCFNGSEDQAYLLEAWHDLTSGDTSFYNLPGGHFYLLEPSNEIFLIKHIRCLENAGL
ncbi:S-acyl fatty acid synthase thioesterase, medium chain [Strigops habroptila]|uniref:S-acyl fatty acid synthase thioesterase, medium chain n=1 Tax=Strigops habroptila TaxID=2489341 RepID=UPI0011CF2908|nr:S-acyl fatty acid synthase thioesterase, medium chain [Strigops habroptila]